MRSILPMDHAVAVVLPIVGARFEDVHSGGERWLDRSRFCNALSAEVLVVEGREEAAEVQTRVAHIRPDPSVAAPVMLRNRQTIDAVAQMSPGLVVVMQGPSLRPGQTTSDLVVEMSALVFFRTDSDRMQVARMC